MKTASCVGLVLWVSVSVIAETPTSTNPHNSAIMGTYERIGVIDPDVEKQYEGRGVVTVPPAYIDEILAFAIKGTPQDNLFTITHSGTKGYIVSLNKSSITCVLQALGEVSERDGGMITLRRSILLSGEGAGSMHGYREDYISVTEHQSKACLLVDTFMHLTKRSLFGSKDVEYRSVVRFRKIPSD